MEMVEVRTDELSGAALDWTVAQCVGQKIELCGDHPHAVIGRRIEGRYQPSTAWSQGGPLIEKYQIGFCMMANEVLASTLHSQGVGSTHLIAACRAIVSAKFGDTVQVPAELTR